MNCEEKVAILMSTYNGSEYISQQLDSIIGQSEKSWELFIRDDGSNDQTIDIIEEYTSKDSRIRIFKNEDSRKNLGPAKSFLSMLSSIDATYYMFCDQDDVWLPNKISKTMEAMLRLETSRTPCLVHTNLNIVDNDLKKIQAGSAVAHDDLKSLVLANDITGCTVMINRYLRIVALNGIESVDIMHDAFLGVLAAVFGKTAYLSEPTMLYRQHGGNAVGTTHGTIDKVKQLSSKKEKERIITSINAANLLLTMYRNKLSKNEIEYLSIIAQLGSQLLPVTLCLMFKYKLYKQSPSATLAFMLKVAINYSSLKKLNKRSV